MARSLPLALLGLLVLTGCRSSRDFVRNLPPGSPVAEYAIRIPEGFEVRSVGFGTAYSTSVSGGGGVSELVLPVSGSSHEQPYIHVYAEERETGQEVLLVFADIRRNAEPVAIVRLERGGSLRVAR